MGAYAILRQLSMEFSFDHRDPGGASDSTASETTDAKCSAPASEGADPLTGLLKVPGLARLMPRLSQRAPETSLLKPLAPW